MDEKSDALRKLRARNLQEAEISRLELPAPTYSTITPRTASGMLGFGLGLGLDNGLPSAMNTGEPMSANLRASGLMTAGGLNSDFLTSPFWIRTPPVLTSATLGNVPPPDAIYSLNTPAANQFGLNRGKGTPMYPPSASALGAANANILNSSSTPMRNFVRNLNVAEPQSATMSALYEFLGGMNSATLANASLANAAINNGGIGNGMTSNFVNQNYASHRNNLDQQAMAEDANTNHNNEENRQGQPLGKDAAVANKAEDTKKKGNASKAGNTRSKATKNAVQGISDKPISKPEHPAGGAAKAKAEPKAATAADGHAINSTMAVAAAGAYGAASKSKSKNSSGNGPSPSSSPNAVAITDADTPTRPQTSEEIRAARAARNREAAMRSRQQAKERRHQIETEHAKLTTALQQAREELQRLHDVHNKKFGPEITSALMKP